MSTPLIYWLKNKDNFRNIDIIDFSGSIVKLGMTCVKHGITGFKIV